MEFYKVSDKLLSLAINTTTACEHVAEIECKIWLIKERVQAIVTMLPYYTSLPKLILMELLPFVVMWLQFSH